MAAKNSITPAMLNSETRIYPLPYAKWMQWTGIGIFLFFGIVLLSTNQVLAATIFIIIALFIEPIMAWREKETKPYFIFNREGIQMAGTTAIPWKSIKSIDYHFRPYVTDLGLWHTTNNNNNNQNGSFMEITHETTGIQKMNVSLHGCDHEPQDIMEILDSYYERYRGPGFPIN